MAYCGGGSLPVTERWRRGTRGMKNDLADARQKIEATVEVELRRLSTISLPYAIPGACEPGVVAHIQFLATRRFTRSGDWMSPRVWWG